MMYETCPNCGNILDVGEEDYCSACGWGDSDDFDDNNQIEDDDIDQNDLTAPEGKEK